MHPTNCIFSMTAPGNDIICAPASGRGGAISIIRVSGSGCLSLVDSVVSFRKGDAASCPGFRVKFGVVPELDEVLVSVFRAPNSYTGEDMAEICCHASSYIVASLLESLCSAGCRMAEPGEFTQRAFVSGKMDLSQAEAVADLISADSAASHKLAFSQLRGAYAQQLRELRAQMMEIAALLELELDFSEEEVEFADRSKLLGLVKESLAECDRLADSFKYGNAFKKGIPVAIVGAVNSGKSTLLNALLGEDRALVSDIPGTTRDTVEELLVLDGVGYRFIDTAGLRETSEVVERMGIERSLQQMDQASVVIVMLDGTVLVDSLLPVVSAVNARLRDDVRVIWVRSKIDAAGLLSDDVPGTGSGVFAPDSGAAQGSGCNSGAFCTRLGIPEVIELSARTGQGLDKLRKAVSRPDAEQLAASGAVLVTNLRHQEALRQAGEHLRRVISGLIGSTPTDLVAEDLRSALTSLGAIFGEILPDDILGTIFSRFCIGK